MEHISEIFIKDFRCLKYFSLELTPKENLNLNVFIGNNGSGKSTLLDALYEIGSSYPVPTSKFSFYIKNDKKKIIYGNRTEENLETFALIKPEKIWNKIIRFYTGSSERCLEIDDINNKNGLSFQGSKLKWILLATFLSGAWKNTQNKFIINILKNLVFNRMTFEPKRFYIDINENENNEDILKILQSSDTADKISEDVTRYIFDLEKITYEKDYSFSLLETLIHDPYVQDTGFWYKKEGEDNEDQSSLFHNESLSDGELGLIRRFSLILLLKELKLEEEKCLVLLDEPETHFNESWKRHFIYLIEEALKDTYHDVFIATHSAMLITDVKREELYRFELANGKIRTYPVSLNTFGANVVDIGQALFDLEADIGERSKKEIEDALNGFTGEVDPNGRKIPFETKEKHKQALEKLRRQVGAGEWRWKIRAKLNQLEKHKEEYCYYLKSKETGETIENL